MACNYHIIIKGIKSGLGSEQTPIKLGSTMETVQEYTKEQLIKDLSKLPKSVIKNLITQLHKAEENYKTENEQLRIKSANRATAIHQLVEHMQNLGVQIIEYDRDDPRYEFKNSDAYTKDGIIYICSDSDITAPMHEMLHLVFGVMKSQDFSKYEKLMKIVSRSAPFKTIYQHVCEIGEYKNMMEYDRKEEAFIRMFEAFANEDVNEFGLQIDEFQVDGEQLFDKVNGLLTPFIQLTFGIEKVPGIMRFFQDSISDLPVNGSTLFIRPKLSTTGYTEHIQKITAYGKIVNLIEKLSTPDINGNRIIEEDCK